MTDKIQAAAMVKQDANGRPDVRQVVRAGLRALVLDVDGTLYKLNRVRRSVIYRFVKANLLTPSQGLLTAKAILAYRKAQEAMRSIPADWCDLGEAQLQFACARSGIEPEFMRSSVSRWMEQECLALLASCLRDGVVELLCVAKKGGLKLAAYSDYPAQSKLNALDISRLFDLVVTAQDPDVQRLKPDPRGLEVVLQRLGVSKHEVIYIGDRPEIDGLAALRAGIGCLIVGRRQGSSRIKGVIDIDSFWELISALRPELS